MESSRVGLFNSTRTGLRDLHSRLTEVATFNAKPGGTNAERLSPQTICPCLSDVGGNRCTLAGVGTGFSGWLGFVAEEACADRTGDRNRKEAYAVITDADALKEAI